MAESNEDQAKPFAALSVTTLSDQLDKDHHYHHHDRTKHVHSRSKLILCCGIIASIALLLSFTFIILSLTVCHLRNPKLTVESISLVQPLEFVNGQVNANRNATVLVMISLRNPNAASFRVIDATVTNYYQLVVIGESITGNETIPGKVGAKLTVKMNLTAEIVTTKLLESVPGLTEDLNGKGVDLRSSVVVSGKVKIMKIFKKSVHLQTNCSMKMMNNSSKITFQDMKCHKQHVHI